MKIIDFLKSCSVSIFVIFVIIVWLLLMQFVFISIEVRMVSTFWYSHFIALAIWAITVRQISRNSGKIKTYLKMKYPRSKPFEFLFFTFLFISTGCLTFLVAFIDDITPLLLNNALYIFTLVFFYSGSITFGWLHYMKRIEG